MPKNNPEDVIKHSAATQLATNISLLQRKAFNVLLANAYAELPDKKVTFHRINLKDLCLLLGYNSNDLEYLKKILVQIRKADVEFNVLHKDRRVEWGNMGLLSEVKMEYSGMTGEVLYSFPPTLREKLYKPVMYIRLNLTLQNRFNSKYSLILYELCLDYLNIKRGFGETPWIKLDKLRSVLGIGTGEYTEYKDLNRYVIKKAIAEINEKSNIAVDIFLRRKGRKVNWLKFKIKLDNENMKKDAFLPPKFHEEKQLSLLDSISKNSVIKELTVDFGVSKGIAEKLVKEYDEKYIKECLELIRDQIKINMKIKNLGGFTHAYIINNYTAKEPGIIERHKAIRKQEQLQKMQEKKREEEERLKNSENTKRCSEIVNYLKLTDPDAYSELRKEAQTKLPQRLKGQEASISLTMQFCVDEFLKKRTKN
jgi:hypothetical protein